MNNVLTKHDSQLQFFEVLVNKLKITIKSLNIIFNECILHSIKNKQKF